MDITNPTPKGISELNRRLLTTLIRSVEGPFSIKDAAAILAFSIPRTHRFLAYLADRGWLVRVRWGLYAAVPLDAVNPGQWRADPWIIASKLYDPFYIGGWTACEHWNLTEQLFLKTVVVTARRVRRKETEVQGFPFLIKHIGASKIFGTRTVWREQTRMNISDPSRTVIDLLDDPTIGGGIRHVADVVDTYFQSEHRDDKLLEDYCLQVGNRAVFKRLGYLLETLDLPAPVLLQECKRSMSSGISLLDPSMPAQGPAMRRWNLRANGKVR